jgi:hypothetical protein
MQYSFVLDVYQYIVGERIEEAPHISASRAARSEPLD